MFLLKKKLKDKQFLYLLLAFFLCTIFFIAYSTLSIVRHNHFNSFGFDLGINDQVVWKYSQLKLPITTIDHVPFISKLEVHVEIIYALISPFYWIWEDARMLILLETSFLCFSALSVFLLSRHFKFHEWIQIALVLLFLLFYGVQNALWFSVHSATFGAAFTSWFIYFLLTEKLRPATLFFLLAILSKENVAGITLLVSSIIFIYNRSRYALYFILGSIIYLLFIFGIYFPHMVESGYRFQNKEGLFSILDPKLMLDTQDKKDVYLYSFLTFGFLPLLAPLFLIPILGNLASYFVLGSSVTTAQGLFLQYRVGLTPLFCLATIMAIKRYSFLNTRYTALYLVLCALVVQYMLHLPLSYLSKSWFWTEPSGVKNINAIIEYIPENSPIVSQNNIIPHVNYRDNIMTLWYTTKGFETNSPCGKTTCDWFRWEGKPHYLIADTSKEWDSRHLLINREEYTRSLTNLEKAGIIKKYKQQGNAVLYVIVKPL